MVARALEEKRGLLRLAVRERLLAGGEQLVAPGLRRRASGRESKC